MIGIITAFWGVFFLSLFVVALTNTLDLNESELRSFILLRRLFTRVDLRECSAKIIQSKFRLKREKEKKKDRDEEKIKQFQTQYNEFYT